MNSLSLHTKNRTELVNITAQVQEAVRQLGLTGALLTLFVPHTTAGITINESADPDVVTDIKAVLEKLVPWQDNYRHGEGNSAAHVKASLMGSSVQLPLKNGRLQLGVWQAIYFCEFDGPRQRSVWIVSAESNPGGSREALLK